MADEINTQTCISLIEQIQEILGEYFTDEAPFEDFIKEIDVYARCQTLNALRSSSIRREEHYTLAPIRTSNSAVLQTHHDGVYRVGGDINGPIVELKENHNVRKRRAGADENDNDEILIDLPERKLIKFIKSPKDRLDAILALEDKVPTLDSIGISSNISKSILKLEMTTGGYDFVRQVLRPVRLCLDNHFDGSKTDFLAYWQSRGITLRVSLMNDRKPVINYSKTREIVILAPETSSPSHNFLKAPNKDREGSDGDDGYLFNFTSSAGPSTTFNQFKMKKELNIPSVATASMSERPKFAAAAPPSTTTTSKYFASGKESGRREGVGDSFNDSVDSLVETRSGEGPSAQSVLSNQSQHSSNSTSSVMQAKRKPKLSIESSYYSNNPKKKHVAIFNHPNKSSAPYAREIDLGFVKQHKSGNDLSVSIPSKLEQQKEVDPIVRTLDASDDEDEPVIGKKRKLQRKADIKRNRVISPESPDPLTALPVTLLAAAKSSRRLQISDDDDDEEEENDGGKGVIPVAAAADELEDDKVVEAKLGKSHAEERVKTELAVEEEVVLFLNTAVESELIDCLSCTVDQAAFILASRPLEDYFMWSDKCAETSGLHSRLKKYKTILLDMADVEGIIKDCDTLAKEIKSVMDGWEVIRKTGLNPNSNAQYEFLLSQASVINPKLKLKGYQLVGISWMLMLFDKKLGGILADEMGLGKTAQVVSFLGTLFERKIFGPHLIVVPSSTLDNWMREINMWCPSLVAIAYTGSQPERRSLQYDIIDNENLNIIVTTYNIATGNGEDRKFLRGRRCKTLFLDEGHMIKNDNSSRTKHLKNLGIDFKILITGTPLQNNLMELLSLLTFIMPDVFESAYDTFAAIFELKNTNNRLEDEVSKRRVEQASKIMNPFVLRRRKDEVLNDIPPKIRQVVNCPMTATQKVVYQDILRDSKKQYLETSEIATTSASKLKKKDIQKSAATLSNVMMQLRKAANHQLLKRKLYTDEMLPAIATDIMKELEFMDSRHDYVVEDMAVMSDFQLHKLCAEYPKVHKYQLKPDDWMNSGKIKVLSEMLPRLIEQGDKILIFSQFVIMLDILELILDTLKIQFLRLDGSTPGNERIGLIDLFNGSSDIPVFLLSTKACGLGINLTSANVVILFDIDFNPHNDAQAEDRAHRVGQTRPVNIYKFVSEGSIEQHMLTCANFKLLLDNKVQDNPDDGSGAIGDEVSPISEKGNEERLLDLVRNDIMRE